MTRTLLALALLYSACLGATTNPAKEPENDAAEFHANAMKNEKRAAEIWKQLEDNAGQLPHTIYPQLLHEGTGDQIPKELRAIVMAYEGRPTLTSARDKDRSSA